MVGHTHQIGDLKMIEITKNYKLTLTEDQARQLHSMLKANKELLDIGSGYDELRPLYRELKELYEFLRGAKDVGHLSVDRDLILVYNELRALFDNGIR